MTNASSRAPPRGGGLHKPGTSVSQRKFPHFRKAGQTILPIKFVDDGSPEIFPDYFSGMSKCFRTVSSAPENGFLRGDNHPHANASATAIATTAAKIMASVSLSRHIPFSHTRGGTDREKSGRNSGTFGGVRGISVPFRSASRSTPRTSGAQEMPVLLGVLWSGQLDSNQRPAVPKTAALPGCAIPRISWSMIQLSRIMLQRYLFV
jgi:hypothetical protein